MEVTAKANWRHPVLKYSKSRYLRTGFCFFLPPKYIAICPLTRGADFIRASVLQSANHIAVSGSNFPSTKWCVYEDSSEEDRWSFSSIIFLWLLNLHHPGNTILLIKSFMFTEFGQQSLSYCSVLNMYYDLSLADIVCVVFGKYVYMRYFHRIVSLFHKFSVADSSTFQKESFSISVFYRLYLLGTRCACVSPVCCKKKPKPMILQNS